jgi:hypothetical protein
MALKAEDARKPAAALRCRMRMSRMTQAGGERTLSRLVTVCLLVAGLACAAVPALAGTGLEAAREELRLRSETERRMREEFESLLANGVMSAAEIADFERYLVRLGMMVDEQRRMVAKLEGVREVRAANPTPLPSDFDRGQTDAEKIAMLDAELGGSLSEFDEKLLREQKEISEKSRAASTGDSGAEGAGAEGSGSEGSAGASGEAADGTDRQAEGGADGESTSNGAESATGGGKDGESGQQADSGEQGGARGETTEGGDQVASAGGASEGGRHTGPTPTPPDIPDGKDDDIVARQLREAAESEQDPELREKLWEEYRKYKRRTP